MSCPMSTPPCLAGRKIYSAAEDEFAKIRRNHRTLAPTGCTAQFCQSGRATHINEPRVGRDRPLNEVQEEAANFLRECRDHGIINSPKELDRRIQEAKAQISASAIETTVTDVDGNQYEGRAGGTWEQTQAEVSHGLKLSWRNAKRCIMRSEYDTLALQDLRHATSSRAMAHGIIDGVRKAFNNGRINPTVFLFPPRQPGSRGPMIWNSQILAFAGYQDDDDGGKILGDPASVEITRSMIEYGWKPPFPRSRWDILPLVTMAEGEDPYMIELPPDLKRTIKITHPQYLSEFEELDLRWVIAPALSRLGFDIGGNQYTASPFIGWFMDSEIGVRNLADAHRYNVLPEMIKTLKLSNDDDTELDELPEEERLLALSRAQAELNFAVHYSFKNERVMMSDTLTCSAKYLAFDGDRKRTLGYSLPADPYWLAPPQGSIIPVWHKGAAPNYQPKPMICRHVQNPIKAWNRQAPDDKQVTVRPAQMAVETATDTSLPRVRILWCSSGVGAAKMARRLHKGLTDTVRDADKAFRIDRPQPLGALSIEESRTEDLVLVIASTYGNGELPSNGLDFVKKYESVKPSAKAPKFSVFGNGDSSYGDTYNAAAKLIHDVLRNVGCFPVFDNHFPGDTVLHNPDWESFDRWTEVIKKYLLGISDDVDDSDSSVDLGSSSSQTTYESTPADILTDLSSATMVKIRRRNDTGIVEVTLDVGHVKFQEMDHVKILSPNLDANVIDTLRMLKLRPEDTLRWHDTNASEFLSKAVDLEQPFKTLNWYPGFKKLGILKRHDLRNSNVNDVLKTIGGHIKKDALEEICRDMQTIRPRIYSVASSPLRPSTKNSAGHVDFLIQLNSGGRFSDKWLKQSKPGAELLFSSSNSDSWNLIQAQPEDAPLILVATGSGVAPVRAVLERRLLDLTKKNQTPKNTISVFLGCRKEDEDLMLEITEPAQEAGLLSFLEIVPSNREKVRVQDKLLLPKVKKQLAKDLRHPQAVVFVCANGKAAEGTYKSLSAIVGKDIKYKMKERYTTEVFDG